jgi:hypothetical protein
MTACCDHFARRVSRDPMLEVAFKNVLDSTELVATNSPDLNEYQFVGNSPVYSIDYMGEGVLCACHYDMPTGLEYGPQFNITHPAINIPDRTDWTQTDGGYHTCTTENQGATIKWTVIADCLNRMFTYKWLCDCSIKECAIQRTFVCTKSAISSHKRVGS